MREDAGILRKMAGNAWPKLSSLSEIDHQRLASRMRYVYLFAHPVCTDATMQDVERKFSALEADNRILREKVRTYLFL